jgi:hypothetical protein
MGEIKIISTVPECPSTKGIPTMTGEMETKLFEASLPYPMDKHFQGINGF